RRRRRRARCDPADRRRCAGHAPSARSAGNGDRRGSGWLRRIPAGGCRLHGRRGSPRHRWPRAGHHRPPAPQIPAGDEEDVLMATRLVIKGGTGLGGEVRVSAAKNAALPALCAALLTSEPVVLENVPGLADVATTRSLLEGLGAEISGEPEGETE